MLGSKCRTLAVLMVVLSRTTTALAIDVPTPSVPLPLIHPLPMKIGLCVTPLLRAGHLRQVKGQVSLEAGDSVPSRKPTWQLGKATVDTFSTAMRAAFTDVVILDACSPGTPPPRDVVAMVIPELVSVESPINSAKNTVAEALFRRAQVELHITLQPTNGSGAVSWDVTGVAAIRHGPWRGNHEEVIGRALSAALLSGCARFMADLYLRPDVEEWLMAQSLPNEVTQ
jgi:hypothetical protein